MALQVADQGVVPVTDVERAVWAGRGVDRPEVAIGRRDDVGLALALQAGAVVDHLHAVDALEADDVGIQEAAPEFLRKMAAGEKGAARGGPGGPVPDGLHARMFSGMVDPAAEGGSEVGVVAGGVDDQVVAPAVEGPAVRVREPVGDVALELSGERFVAEDGAVDVAHRAFDALNLRAVKNAVAQQQRAARLVDHRVCLVVGIGRIEAHEHALLPVGTAVAVGVAHEPQVGRLHDEQAVLEEVEAGRAVQPIEIHGALVGAAVAVGVLEDEDLVGDLRSRGALGVIRPHGHPEASLPVPRHLHGFRQLGELFLAGEEVHLQSRSGRHELGRLVAVDERISAVDVRARFVGAESGHDRQGQHLDGSGLAGRRRPDLPLEIGGHDVALRHLLHQDLRVGDLRRVGMGDVGDLRAVAVDVVTVDGAVA